MLGIININKPSGISSSSAVVKVKKTLHISRVGHLGTLDPLASGVLPICVGKATRLFDYFLNKTKTYVAEFSFSYLTTTLDSEGEIIEKNLYIPTKKEIEQALPKLRGEIMQVPPMYSSKSVNGVRAYKLARQGKTVELQPKKVNIIRFDYLQQLDEKTHRFEIECSSGTYIRSLCRDLAELLGTQATMTKLTRTRCGIFTIENSLDLDDLSVENIEKKIKSINDVLIDLDGLSLNEEQYRLLSNGVAIPCDKEGLLKIVFEDMVVGLGQTKDGMLKITTNLKE